ncbi:MAG TPA: hypothetical protein VFK94_05290 [Patescibacteria group bacterium]|nr:hypothetical protein [Patescibacteria group bacterium]
MTEQTTTAPTNDGGFFDDLADVELGVKDGKYPAYIVKSEIVTKKDSTKAWVVTYRISDGAQKGENVQEWFNTYPHDADKNANARKWRARRLESLGVPESQWTSFNPADVIGTFVIIGVKTSNGYTNVSSVQVANENDATLASQIGASATVAPKPAASVSDLM